jgi:MFS family permease
VILGMIVTMFPKPGEQAKALGVYGFVASAGGSIGLLSGGVLTDLISWHWIFLINLPVGVLTGVLALRLIGPGVGVGVGADIRGAMLLIVGVMLGVYTILGITEHGWTSNRTVGLAGIAAVLLAAFLVRQARIENPLMPLRLFRSRNVTGSNLVMAMIVVGMFGLFFLGALYLQRILGYTPLEVGLAFLPSTVVMGIVSLRASQPLIMRHGPQRVLVPSLLATIAGVLLFARTPVDGHFVVDILPATLLIGLGAGLSTPAVIALAMSGATPEDSGLASGLVNTTVQVGGAIGLAVLATLASERTGDATSAAALNSGYHLAYLIGAGALVVAVVISLVVLRTPRAAGGASMAVPAHAG